MLLVFDKYEVIRRLAIGGMGEIFLARQTGVAGFERLVILKNLLPELAEQDHFIDQFLDEARVAATLNHPNIVSIFEVGLWQGVHFIAMEYIHGTSLSNLLKQLARSRQRVPPAIAARIIHDAAMALDHAHHAKDARGQPLNLVHRDVSPQNIMVRDDGLTKVVDFGIAKAANRSTRTATGELKGKLTYMPPEQIAGVELDGRSDQFSLGVVFWELCTSRRLFQGDNPIEVFRVITNTPVPRLSESIDGFPEELDLILMRMLAKSPDNRYPCMRDVATDLETFLGGRSRETSESQVAAFVRRHMGDVIDAVTSDLTPSQDNYVISFRTPSQGGALDTENVETRAERSGEARSPRPPRGGETLARLGPRRLAVAAAALLSLIALGLWGLRGGSPAGQDDVMELSPVEVKEATLTPDPASSQPGTPEAEAPPVLSLTTVPPDATVSAGGVILGTTPVDIETLAPGVRHLLTVQKPGYKSQDLELEIEPGQRLSRRVTLERLTGRVKTAPPPSATAAKPEAQGGTGYLTIRTKPWTKVSCDGDPLGSTPLFKRPISPGRHSCELVNEAAGVRATRVITVKPGATHKLDLELSRGSD